VIPKFSATKGGNMLRLKLVFIEGKFRIYFELDSPRVILTQLIFDDWTTAATTLDRMAEAENVEIAYDETPQGVRV